MVHKHLDHPHASVDMSEYDEPTWADLFEYRSTRNILLFLWAHPDEWFSQSDIAREIDINHQTVSDRMPILIDSGVVESEQRGMGKYNTINEKSNILEALELINYELSKQIDRGGSKK